MSDLITDAMVETAAQIMWDTPGPGNWDELPEVGRDLERQAMRAALEAVAPLIAAKALRDAAATAARSESQRAAEIVPSQPCPLPVGDRPYWMSEDQWDPCSCIHLRNHEGPCECSHTSKTALRGES